MSGGGGGLRRTGALRLEAQAEGDVVHVALEGELDLAGRRTLLDLVAAQPLEGRHLHLDLSGLSFMDSTGCRALLELRAAEDGRGGAPMVVTAARTGAVQRLLQLTGLAGALSVDWVEVDDDAG